MVETSAVVLPVQVNLLTREEDVRAAEDFQVSICCLACDLDDAKYEFFLSWHPVCQEFRQDLFVIYLMLLCLTHLFDTNHCDLIFFSAVCLILII